MLRAPIASGGMAQVWTADDLVLNRVVAVKLLHPHLASQAEFVSRFRSEARAAARLGHPSIVAIFDTVSDSDIEGIVMELLDGSTLRTFLDTYGPLDLTDAVDILRQIAGALDAAHRKGIIHRDVKPGNIMLCADRRVKVTDFGIAKALDGNDATAPGLLLGTAKYLAPEQVEGAPVDARTDVYALGVVLYEALTGTAPFDEDSDAATALARLRRPPGSLRVARPDLPLAVDHVVCTALSRHPDDRYRTATAFADAFSVAVDPSASTPTIDLRRPFAPVLELADREQPTPVAAPPLDPTGRLETPAPAEPSGRSHPGRGRALVVTLVVATCAALAAALILGGTTVGDPNTERSTADGTIPTSTAVGTSTITIAGSPVSATIASFDPPPGDGSEHPERLPALLDGDPTTGWTSESYSTPRFGGLKPGVGVVVELASARTLDALTVRSVNEDWGAQIYLSDADPLNLRTITAWGRPVDEKTGVNGDGTFDLRRVNASAVLIWITNLGGTRIELDELELS